MWKEHKGKLIVTSALMLLPMVVGLILWNRLPDSIAIHFGPGNVPDGWAGKGMAVFGLPGLLLGLHLLCLGVTGADPRRRNIGRRSLALVFWILPVVSLTTCSATYAVALGVAVNIEMVCALLLGVVLIIVGNVLPKTKQNYTFGIKLPWTLHDPENWNHTHRFGGWCMVIAGALLMVTSFLGLWQVTLGVLLTAALAPMIYSYLYDRRHREETP